MGALKGRPYKGSHLRLWGDLRLLAGAIDVWAEARQQRDCHQCCGKEKQQGRTV